MNNNPLSLPSTRREFLKLSSKGIGLLAFTGFAPSFLVESTLAQMPAAEKDRSILVLIQLAGGNDGLNTLVPFEDPNYYRLRPNIALAKDQLIPIAPNMALHNACAAMQPLFKDGKLGIIQNVGYPNPNRSHFRSTEIWETASDSADIKYTGWLGRFFDNDCNGPSQSDPVGIHIGNQTPESFSAEKDHPLFSIVPGVNRQQRKDNLSLLENLVNHETHLENNNDSFLKHTMMDALVTERKVQKVLAGYKAETEYPNSQLALSLRNIAALIAGGISTRVYFVTLSGFDTHVNQLNNQGNLLRTLSEALSAFQKDLEAHKLDQQVLTMTFSEFGRRPSENESRGTDHGTSAPLFVMGSQVQGGLLGTSPDLNLPKNQDINFSTDFRQVYATVLDRWLDSKSTSVLGKAYQPIDFLKSRA